MGKKIVEYFIRYRLYIIISIVALLIIIKQMIQKDEFKNMTIEIENAIQTLNYNLKSIKIDSVLNRMGFPINWKELSKIERSKDSEEE